MRTHDDITSTVENHSDTVLRVCSLYFHGRPERDDAFQETFLKYALSEKEFEGDEHRKAWLIRVAANVCKDMLKRAEAKVELIDDIDESAQTAWQAAQDGSPADELYDALKNLEDKYRIALYLKYYEGYSAVEIASMLDMPENTVYTNLARGRNKLKEVLERGATSKA